MIEATKEIAISYKKPRFDEFRYKRNLIIHTAFKKATKNQLLKVIREKSPTFRSTAFSPEFSSKRFFLQKIVFSHAMEKMH